MASSGGFKIDHDYVSNLGKQWSDLPNALDQMRTYSTFNGSPPGDPLQPPHFGGTPTAASAAQAFMTLMTNLATSVGKARDFTDSVSKAFTATAQASSDADAENSMNILTSGQGA